jgi:hypothetical protein
MKTICSITLSLFALSMCASASDLEAPALTEFAFTPTVVNISAAPQNITFTARFTDNLSGVDYPTTVRFQSPSGAHQIYPYFDEYNRLSGSATDGVYQEVCTIPQYSETGVWTLHSLTMSDAVGNSTYLDGAEAISYFSSRGFPHEITVTGTADLAPPALTEFAFTPTVVNISAAPQNITFTARFTDNLSGLDYPTTVRFQSPSGAHQIYPYFDEYNRLSGSATDGVYQEVCTIPQYSETGVWTLHSLTMSDAVGNSTYLDGAEAISYFSSRGFPGQFVVVDNFSVELSPLPDQNVRLRWRSVTNVPYCVESTDRLTNPQWNDVSGPLTGNGGYLSFSNPIPTDAGAVFYRVRVQSLP